jgi:hypothetical protein
MKTFCILPWIHISSRPNGDMRLCCTANASSSYCGDAEIGIVKEDTGVKSNFGKNDLYSSWNSEYMRNVRLMMLTDQIPDVCKKCFEEEKAGHISKRKWETEYWERRIDIPELIENTEGDGSIPEKIQYFDLRFGRKCDLKCIMCTPNDSSMWLGDWAKIYPQIKNESLKEQCGWNKDDDYNWVKNNPKFLEQLYEQIPHMQQLYMAGGEALIINEYDQLLDKIIESGHAKNITLRYNSNGLTLSNELIEKWKHFKYVRFHFSLDSIYDMNTYIRYPSSFEIIEEKLKMLDKTDDNVEVTIACAVQALNVYYIPDLITWKLSQNYKKINKYPAGGGFVNFHLVYLPSFFNVKVLPKWFKKKTKDKYEMFYKSLELYDSDYELYENDAYAIPRLKGIINFMMSDDWSYRLPELREFIKLIDKTRQTNFNYIFPEMRGVLNA